MAWATCTEREFGEGNRLVVQTWVKCAPEVEELCGWLQDIRDLVAEQHIGHRYAIGLLERMLQHVDKQSKQEEMRW